MRQDDRKSASGLKKTPHPGIYRKANGRYLATCREYGKQRRKTFDRLADAKEFKARCEAGVHASVPSERFEEYARRWIDTYQGRTSRGVTPRTLTGYRFALENHAIPFFRGYKLGEVRAREVREFVAHLHAQGLTPGSVSKYVAPVRAMFATAYEDGSIVANPAAGIRVNGQAQRRSESGPRALTRSELRYLVFELPPEWRLIFELLYSTGLRISEALGLDWSDIDFGDRPLLRVRRQFYRGEIVTPKTANSIRDIPLAPELSKRLFDAREKGSGDGPIFATRTGNRLSDHNVRRVLRKARDRAGVPHATPHSLRHTCASLLLENGKTIQQVSSWLGHADAAFTLSRYIHLLDDGLGDAAFFDSVFEGVDSLTSSVTSEVEDDLLDATRHSVAVPGAVESA